MRSSSTDAEITGNVFAWKGFQAHGAIRAAGATIKGQLILDGATLHNPDNPDNYALILSRAEIIGGVFARDGFQAHGATPRRGRHDQR